MITNEGKKGDNIKEIKSDKLKLSIKTNLP